MKRSYVVFLIAIVILVAVYVMYQYAVESPYRISSEDAKRRMKEVDLVLDVRTGLERRNLGFYPGSVHIQSSDLKERMPREYPNKNIRILAYCNTGHRARAATDILHGLGYVNTVYIATTYRSLL